MSRRTAEAVSAVVLFNLSCPMDVWKWPKDLNLNSMVCLTSEQPQGMVYRSDLFFLAKGLGYLSVENTPANSCVLM